MSKRSKYCLVGIPDHQGVMNVGGRLGAARGPAEFRLLYSSFKGVPRVLDALIDAGDLRPIPRDIQQSHRKAADLVRDEHARAGLSVVVGGGHDHGYSQLLGVSEALAGKKIGCINIDAHLDVRKPKPIISSGSPFYLALETGLLTGERFVEFGIQSHCNAPELWEYVRDKKVELVRFEELRHGRAIARFQSALKQLAGNCDAIVISLDLDAASSSFAPGVSAPQAEGFTASEIIEMCELAGDERKVISLGIFELCPEHDIDRRTARLAATAAHHFINHALDA